MADNVAVTPGAGATIATDDVAGIQHQRVKVEWGPDGTANETDTASGKALPIQLRNSTGTELGTSGAPVRTDPTGTTTQPVSLASSPLPTGAASSANQTTQITAEQAIQVAVELIDNAIYTDGVGTPGAAIGVAGTDGTNPQILKTDSSGELQIDVLTLPALSAGTNNIGDVDVLTLPALVAGTALIGKVGIDQTTPGTTNGVQVNAALPAGTNAIGKLAANDGIDIGDVTINNASLAVTGTFWQATQPVSGTVDTELTTADLDTGAGTDTRAVVGLVGSASGGGALIPGSATDGLLVNLGANNDVTVTGSVTANAGTNLNTSALATEVTAAAIKTAVEVLDNAIAGSEMQVDVITVPAPLSTTGGGVEATALRVTLASDSTGLVSVDDNGGALTVDNAGTFAVQAAQSGTWTAQIGNTPNTTPILASIHDGTTKATVRDLASNDALNVAIVDASGGQITTFGGGTEYTTDAAAPAAPVGGTILAERDDQLAALTEIEGDWTNLRASSKGALWVTIPDASGDPITSFGGGTQYTEDAAAAANPVGTALNLIRDDARAGSLTTADGDNVAARGTNAGELYVKHVDTIASTQSGTWNVTNVSGTVSLPTGASTAAKQPALGTAGTASSDVLTVQGIASMTALKVDGSAVTQPVSGTVTANAGTNLNTSALATEVTAAAIKTSVELLDDAVVADDAAFTPATTKVLMAGFEFDDTTPDSVNEGDAGAARMSANRNIYTTIRDAAGNERGVNVSASNALIVDGSAATQPVSGTFWQATQPVSGTVTANAGTGSFTVAQATASNLNCTEASAATIATNTSNAATALQIMDDWDNVASDGCSVSGDVAHDAADAGEPVKVGGVAVSGSASPTSVASGDRTRFIANQHGIPYTIAGHPNLIVREYDFGVTAQTDLNLAAALVATDERIYVTGIEITINAACTDAVSARVGFGTAFVPAASATGVSGMIASHPGIVPGGGIVIGDGSAVIAVGAAGDEPRITTSAATGGDCHVVIRYFLIDETP